MSKTKTCGKCGDEKPADRDHFDPANRSPDLLSKDCKVCRGTVRKPAAAAGTKPPQPRAKKASKQATKKKAAKKKRAAAPLTVGELVIPAAGEIRCKVMGEGSGKQFLLEQDGALIVCEAGQLLQLVGWGTLQLKKAA